VRPEPATANGTAGGAHARASDAVRWSIGDWSPVAHPMAPLKGRAPELVVVL